MNIVLRGVRSGQCERRDAHVREDTVLGLLAGGDEREDCQDQPRFSRRRANAPTVDAAMMAKTIQSVRSPAAVRCWRPEW